MLYNTMIPATGYFWLCKWKEYDYETRKWDIEVTVPFKPYETLTNKQVQDLSAWKNGSKERKIQVLADYKFKINDLIYITFGNDEVRYKITGVEYEEDTAFGAVNMSYPNVTYNKIKILSLNINN